jgi:hypothetical protein
MMRANKGTENDEGTRMTRAMRAWRLFVSFQVCLFIETSMCITHPLPPPLPNMLQGVQLS